MLDPGYVDFREHLFLAIGELRAPGPEWRRGPGRVEWGIPYANN